MNIWGPHWITWLVKLLGLSTCADNCMYRDPSPMDSCFRDPADWSNGDAFFDTRDAFQRSIFNLLSKTSLLLFWGVRTKNYSVFIYWFLFDFFGCNCAGIKTVWCCHKQSPKWQKFLQCPPSLEIEIETFSNGTIKISVNLHTVVYRTINIYRFGNYEWRMFIVPISL